MRAPHNLIVRLPVDASDRNAKLAALAAKARVVDRLIFRATVLVMLFGFSTGPVFRTDLLARNIGVIASAALATLAGLYLFRRRRPKV